MKIEHQYRMPKEEADKLPPKIKLFTSGIVFEDINDVLHRMCVMAHRGIKGQNLLTGEVNPESTIEDRDHCEEAMVVLSEYNLF